MNSNLQIKAVVFDMDGLMFDTEKLTYEIIKETMEEKGFKFTLDFYKTTVGKRSADVIKLYKEKFGESFDYQEMKAENMEKFRRYTEKNGIPIKKGLFSLLDYLKEKDMKIALATSTTTKSATEMLKRAGVLEYFDELLCAESVEKGKPHPDVFLKAAEKLKFPPESCIGLEDSFNGVISSSEAGLITIMIPDLLEPTKEIKNRCYKVIQSLDQVIEIIE